MTVKKNTCFHISFIFRENITDTVTEENQICYNLTQRTGVSKNADS